MNEHSENSILALAEQFRDMEARHKLFDLKSADDIYYWDILRYQVHLVLLAEKGFFPQQTNVGNKREPTWKRILKACRLLPLVVINELRLYLFLSKEKKYIFLFNSRFQDSNGNPEDSLTREIYDQIQADTFNMEIFRHRNFNWIKGNVGHRYFMYKLELSYLLGRNLKDPWSQLAALINEEFQVNIWWEELFHTLINRYRKEYAFFTEVFKKIKPHFLFFQFYPKGMISAANDLNITTVDIQHGVTNKAVVNYYYPKTNLTHIPSIPKVLLTLGDYWNRQINIPSRLISLGNSYYYIEPDASVFHRRGVMVVSVIFNYEDLKQGTARLANEHPELVFYYKLHSGQKHQEADCRSYFSSFANVKVVYTEKNVYEIMNDCFAVVLIHSSVAYQALQKGLNVFILKKQYHQISSDIFDLEGVWLADDWQSLSEHLEQKPQKTQPIMFFEPYNAKVLDSLVN